MFKLLIIGNLLKDLGQKIFARLESNKIIFKNAQERCNVKKARMMDECKEKDEK